MNFAKELFKVITYSQVIEIKFVNYENEIYRKTHTAKIVNNLIIHHL